MLSVDRSASLEPLARKWIRTKNTANPSPNTVAARRRDLVAIAEVLGDELERADPAWLTRRHGDFERQLGRVGVGDLTPDAIALGFATYAGGHAPASIRRVASTWRGFCRWLVRQQLLATNPIETLESPKARPWRPKPVSEDDLALVVAAAGIPSPTARQPWAELEAAICALLCAGGVRVGELLALKVGDMHRSPTELVRLHVEGKGGRTRTVPLPPEAVASVDAYLDSRRQRIGRYEATDRLVLRADGSELTRRAVDHLVLGWFRRAGVAPPGGDLAHSLRHTYATLLVDHGGSLPEVQAMLGHANLATTQAYLAVTAHGTERTALANPVRQLLRDQQRRSSGDNQ